MTDTQSANEQIIDLTELIEKGPGVASKAAPKAEDKSTGTDLASLNDTSTPAPDGDIDSLLAQMDAGDQIGVGGASPPAVQPEGRIEEPTADATGHIVDPHETLDMSGMAEVDDLLSSLNIPLKPNSEEGGTQAQTGGTPASPPTEPNNTEDEPFDLNALLNPDADMGSSLNAASVASVEEMLTEPTMSKAAKPAPDSLDEGAVVQAKAPAAKPQGPRELAAELDDILASVGEPALPEETVAQPPSALPDVIPVESSLEASALDDLLFTDAPEEVSVVQSERPAEDAEETDIVEAVVNEIPGKGTETVAIAPALPEEVRERLATLEKGQEASALLVERLRNVEIRLESLETAIPDMERQTKALESLESRLASLESPTAAELAPENPSADGETKQALHAYMELSAHLDEIETRLNAVTEFAPRLDTVETRLNAIAEFDSRLGVVETRLNAVTAQFETRVEKAAATAAAKMLREEIAKLLTA